MILRRASGVSGEDGFKIAEDPGGWHGWPGSRPGSEDHLSVRGGSAEPHAAPGRAGLPAL